MKPLYPLGSSPDLLPHPQEHTLYVQGVAMKPKDSVLFSLMKLYGVHQTQANSVLAVLGRNRITKRNERTPERRESIDQMMKTGHVEGGRRRHESMAIQRHLKLGSLRGIRLRRGRPTRGQRTRSNARSAKRLNSRRR
jgi:small subunit ribosomal protein S13